MRVGFVLVGLSFGVILVQSIADAQTRTSDVDQRAIEIASIVHSPGAASGNDGFAFDPKLYMGPAAYSLGPNPTFKADWVLTQKGWSSEVATSHTAVHLAEVARLLSLKNSLSTDSGCTSDAPTVCRVGSNKGAIAFSPAFARGDTAQIVTYRIEVVTSIRRPDGTVTTGLALDVSTSHFLLIKEKSGWRVIAYRTGAS